ncbi:hypothetical protein FRC06_009729, partial [Ceratobasidium sp. 370]
DEVECFLAYVYVEMKRNEESGHGKLKEHEELLWENSRSSHSNTAEPSVVHKAYPTQALPEPHVQRKQVNPSTFQTQQEAEESEVEDMTRVQDPSYEDDQTVHTVLPWTPRRQATTSPVQPTRLEPHTPLRESTSVKYSSLFTPGSAPYHEASKIKTPEQDAQGESNTSGLGAPFTPVPGATKISGAGPRRSGRVTETVHPSSVHPALFNPMPTLDEKSAPAVDVSHLARPTEAPRPRSRPSWVEYKQGRNLGGRLSTVTPIPEHIIANPVAADDPGPSAFSGAFGTPDPKRSRYRNDLGMESLDQNPLFQSTPAPNKPPEHPQRSPSLHPQELMFQLDMEEMASHLINQVEVDQTLQEEADQEEEEEDLQDLLQDGLERGGYSIGLSSLPEDLQADLQADHQDLQADHQDLQEDHQDHQDPQGLAEIITIIGSMDHKALEA